MPVHQPFSLPGGLWPTAKALRHAGVDMFGVLDDGCAGALRYAYWFDYSSAGQSRAVWITRKMTTLSRPAIDRSS